MVAKIESGKSIRGILHYNENKVTQDQAQLILASGFAGEIEKLNFSQKLNRFTARTEQNSKVKTNALHISLNFDPSDKLDNAKFQQIALDYMERIGFGDQPFLVYRHLDAHHPHLHIATTNIKADGERIDIHGIGYQRSEPARKELEVKYGLIVAEGRETKQGQVLQPAVYGERPTKQMIGNLVTGVMRQYLYSSFSEYKAVLEDFNIRADRGNADSRMFENKGLLYSVLDQQGQSIGVQIKASQIHSRPTLSELEKRFEKNTVKRHAYQGKLKDEIDLLLTRPGKLSPNLLKAELSRVGISVRFRKSEHGQLYGITYIDHRNKTVFNGSDLGKAYSAKAMSARFEQSLIFSKKTGDIQAMQHRINMPWNIHRQEAAPSETTRLSFLDIALARDQTEYALAFPKRRKKRKKGKVIQSEQQLTL